MGKYGYKFIGNAGFAMQYYKEANKSLSSEQNPNSESIDAGRDGRPPMSDNSGQRREKASSTESSNAADCLYKLAIALAKHKKKYIDREK